MSRLCGGGEEFWCLSSVSCVGGVVVDEGNENVAAFRVSCEDTRVT